MIALWGRRLACPFFFTFLFAAAAWAQPPALPSFDQYPASGSFSGKPATPVLRTAEDREFRTKIREGVAEGPNFAGHYTVVAWGCGAGCVSIATVDAKDGRVYHGPFKVLAWQLLLYEGKIVSTGDFEPLAFQKNSRLLIARGCPEEDNCASYFYEFTGSEYKLIRKVPAAPVPEK